MAMRNPSPGAPSRHSASTRTSRNSRSMQPRPRTPSESSAATRVIPALSIGTRKALTPRPRKPGCVAAKTITRSAASALATQTFRPLSA